MKQVLILLLSIFFATESYSQESADIQFLSAFEQDEYAKAKELIPSVLSIPSATLQVDPEHYCDLMNTIGLVLCNYDEYTKAATYFELARAKTLEVFGDTSYYAGLYSYNLAMTFENLGRYNEAEPLYLQSLPILALAYGQTSIEYTRAYYQLVLMYTEMGRYVEAEPMNNAVNYFFEVILGKENEDYQGARNNLARIYRGMGQYEKAEEIFKENLAYCRRNVPEKIEMLQTILNNLGELYIKMGKYDESEPLLKECLQIIGSLENYDPLDSATSCNNAAILYKSMGDYSTAEYYFLTSIAIYERMGMANHPDYTNPMNNLGDMYRIMGMYEKATELLEKVISIREQLLGTSHHNYANAVNNLALVYFNSGHYKESEEMYLIAKEIYRTTLGELHDYYATALNNLAVLYRVAGFPKEAEANYLECLRITEQVLGKKHRKYALYLNGAGVLYGKMGDYKKAVSMIMEAMEIVKDQLGEKNYDYIDMVYNLAETYRDAGDIKKASAWYPIAMDGYIELINSYFPTLSEKEKTDFYYTMSFRFETFNSFVAQQILNNEYSANNLVALMYNYQLVTKSLLLNEMSNIRSKVNNSGDAALIEVYNEWENKQKNLALQYRLSADELILNDIDLPELEKELNSLEKQLSDRISRFKNQGNSSITWRDISSKLKENEAAVEVIRMDYFEGDWTDSVYYAVLTITRGCEFPSASIIKYGKTMETHHIKEYRNAIWNSKEDDSSYSRFWVPIKESIKDKQKIYLSPDGVYHQMNLYTLKNPKTGNYVIEETEILLLTNSKDLLSDNTQSNSPKGVLRTNHTAEVFGYPDYEYISDSTALESYGSDGLMRYGYQSLVPLPGTKVEALGVQQIMKENNYEVSLLLEANASEKALKAVQSPKVLHIATHGYFLKNEIEIADMVFGINAEKSNTNPLFRSGLMLAGAAANARRSAANLDEEDGIFSAYEAMLLDLENTSLVVLSACETGLGEVRNGQGVYGLQRAFMVAGADAIMMSLWQVEDKATQELMKEFYGLWLKEKGLSKQDAFRQAQIKLKQKYPSPIYWGAFVMVGQ